MGSDVRLVCEPMARCLTNKAEKMSHVESANKAKIAVLLLKADLG